MTHNTIEILAKKYRDDRNISSKLAVKWKLGEKAMKNMEGKFQTTQLLN